VDRVVAIFGPTASGKTAVAVELALLLGDAEIVSADSMQVYRGLERITNQPSPAERRGVPHHLVGCVDPDEPYDVVRYAKTAHAAIDAILERGATPIVVGGSGLYLRAALADVAFPPPGEEEARARLRAEVAATGPAAAHARLAAVDPDAAARIAPADSRRIVRARELAEQGGSLAPNAEDALWSGDTRHPTRLFGLVVGRAGLHARIDERTPRLLEAGIAQVEELLASPSGLSATAERAHGVDDIREHLAGRIDRAECERRLATRTRQYAKRQDTWRRRLPRLEAVPADGPAAQVAGDIAVRLAREPRYD
jgi:tRNA dimethylallyltransferase